VALSPVANKPLICHAVRDLAEAGIRHVYVAAAARQRDRIVAALSDEGLDDVLDGWVETRDSAPLSEILRAAGRFLGEDPFVVRLGDSLSHAGLDVLQAEVDAGGRPRRRPDARPGRELASRGERAEAGRWTAARRAAARRGRLRRCGSLRPGARSAVDTDPISPRADREQELTDLLGVLHEDRHRVRVPA